jgi:quercetin dioxygenase-like cupin family protein
VRRHPQQRMAYVLAGKIRFSTPGDMVIGMLESWHPGETLGTGPVRLLVIDLTEGKGSNAELHP